MSDVRITQEEVDKIPKLPRGQGSMFVSADKQYIIYKKTVNGKLLLIS